VWESSSIWEWLTNQEYIHNKMKSRLNLGNACYHSVLNLLTFYLSKNSNIAVYKIVILPVLYRHEIWWLKVQVVVVLVVMPYSGVVGYQYFGGHCCIHLEHWYPNTSLHGVAIQKTTAWIVIAMRTWILQLVRVFQNRELRRIFVLVGWRKLHKEELHKLHSSPNNIEVIRSRNEMGEACSMSWEMCT
jgi:hypothetical protein